MAGQALEDSVQKTLSSVAHELRSPLAGLVALLDLMESGADGPLTSAQSKRLVRIRAELARVASLADLLRDLALVEAGRLHIEHTAVDLRDVATRAARSGGSSPVPERARLRLRLPADLPPVRGDAGRLHQILALLMTRAFQRAAGVPLELSASAHGDVVEVTIREAATSLPVEALPTGGIAVSAGAQASLSDDAGRLEIAVARGLVELHGGRLNLAGDAASGVLASFTLPADRSGDAAVSRASSRGQTARSDGGAVSIGPRRADQPPE